MSPARQKTGEDGPESGAALRERLRVYGERLVGGTDGVFHFPIRHHSPACALHLKRALAELRPAAIVLEMPADFEPLVPLLAHQETEPPIAIVSVIDRDSRDRFAPAVLGYWPISDSAPEWVALKAAGAIGASLHFADLPSGVRLSLHDEGEQETSAARLTPQVLTDEDAITYSNYAQALIRRVGARDFNEVWDRLFESRVGDSDWRQFFADVGRDCLLCRETTSERQMAEDGMLAREAMMRDVLAEAKAAAGGRPVAAIFGGIHTPALLDPPSDPQRRPENGQVAPSHAADRAYLVRYTEADLDLLNGYASGMPSPRHYARLLAMAETGDHAASRLATETFLDLAEALRRREGSLPPALPTLTEAVRHAEALARLRELPGPGRSEILDAARSCLLKDEDLFYGSDILETLHELMTGAGIGKVPKEAGTPPLLDAARRRAEALRFSIDEPSVKTRQLDIHRKARHRAASRFAHAMALLETDFATLKRGPNLATAKGMKPVLFEVWTYAWLPSVEARLTALAATGDTLEAACVFVLREAIVALENAGRSDDSEAAVALLGDAAKAGVLAHAHDIFPHLDQALAADADFSRLVRALARLEGLWRGRRVLGLSRTAALAPLVETAYRRTLDLIPTLIDAPAAAMPADARALADLYHLTQRLTTMGGADETVPVQGQEGAAPASAPRVDRAVFEDRLRGLIAAMPQGALAGVLATIGFLSGWRSEGDVAQVVRSGLEAASLSPQERCGPLDGALAVSAVLLRRSEEVLGVVDAFLARIDEDSFLSLLPALRKTLSVLDPDEVDALAARIGSLQSLPAPLDLDMPHVGESEVRDNLARSRALTGLIEARGLDHWLRDEREEEAQR
ncbi:MULTISPECIES: DUF5682 family protein [unclassified Modicisalibacter]|uniref:DUF5682 family protein n=1 Tax=unclassified Modicisalibacter TaxID=2679913 RepID=UPI001CCC9AC7|nr:hypothetical protein [Modicisalibacter sp. R2A 31.J]MBZ9575184.1 hypothetical protein [Modicisalibacter sp. MOD 31.J]